MNKRNSWKGAAMVFASLAALFAFTSMGRAGTIILEGSDAIGYHCGYGNVSACTYTEQVWKALDGSSGKPIAVFGNTSSGNPVLSQGSGVTIDDFASVSAAGTLSDYAALYFLAGGGCCAEDDSLITGNEAAVSAYLAGGGTVMIENYIGGSAWDFAVGAGGLGNSHVIGVGGGAGGGTGCDDGETVTATGLANGFTQPGYMGCWEHQGYQESFFGPLGFTKSFFDAAPGMGGAGWSGLLSNGLTETGKTPEPSSLVLLGSGLLGLAGAAKRRLLG